MILHYCVIALFIIVVFVLLFNEYVSQNNTKCSKHSQLATAFYYVKFL